MLSDIFNNWKFSSIKSFAGCVCKVASVVSDCATLRTAAHQAPLFMKLSRQESWSGLPCPPLGDLPEAGIEPVSFMSPALAGGFFTTSTTWEAQSFADCP